MMYDTRVIEQTEIAAWKDLLDAAPGNFAKSNGLRYAEIGGGLAINFQQMPIPLFNRVIGSGLMQPLTKDLIEQIGSFYGHGEQYLIHYSAPMQPNDAEEMLKHEGYYLAGSWERVVRNNSTFQKRENNEIQVKLVDDTLTEDWARFLCDTYQFDFYEWPQTFAARKGWRHYLAYKAGNIVACRSFFFTNIKTVFSGVDGPVPGVMTSDTEPDFAIWEQAINDLLNDGATLFVADIELPDRMKNRSAYDGFARMGFEIPYTRYHYRLNK